MTRPSAALDLAGLATALETLSAELPDPVYMIGPDGALIAFNPAFAAPLGLEREQLLGMSFEQLVDPEHLPAVRAEFQACLAGSPRRYRAFGRLPDGTAVTAEVTNLPVRVGGEVVAVLGSSLNLTNVDQREGVRREQAELLRMAGGMARFGGWSLDGATQMLTLTEQSRDILGLPSDDVEPRPVSEAIRTHAAADEERIGQVLAACFSEGTPFEIELALRRLDDVVADVRVVGEAVRDANGAIVAAHGALWDVSETEHARRRADQLERRLEATLKGIADGLQIFDNDWRITYSNERALQLMRRSLDSVMGKSVWELYPEAVGSPWHEAYLRAKREGTRTTVRAFVEEFDAWLEATAYPIDSGLVLYLRDVTEEERSRERAERAQRKVADQAALLDAARDAIMVRDLDHRILYWNRSASELYGYAPDEVVGQSILELLRPDPERFEHAVATTVQEGFWADELVKHARDGREVIVDCRWQVLYDADGEPQRILSVDTDITEWRREEQMRMRAERMESLGTLAGGIAHDLNNVLTPILMSVQLLEQSEQDAGRLEILSTMETAIKRGADMIRQVLAFARGIEGRRVRVSVRSLLADAEAFARDTLPTATQLELEIDADLPDTMGDPTQLMQVLTNLITNARDAMPHGGSLRIEASTLELEDEYSSLSHLAQRGRYIGIEVIDTGDGMPAEVSEKIFEPFFTTKEHGKGTGLGLASSLAIVRSHGGFMRVYSEHGRGTRFSVILPIAEGELPEPRAVTIAPNRLPRGSGELVLVVDDEESIRTITSQTLRAHGYRAVTAANGEEAIAIVEHGGEPIDLVLTDMMMPVMDGPATTAYLEENHPAIPIIAASGLSSGRRADGSVGMGVSRFLSKPYTTSLLLMTIREVLLESRADGVDSDAETKDES